MLKVLFFAQLRERLGLDKLELDAIPDDVGTLRDLLAEKGDTWAQNIQQERCLAAVNQVIVDDNKVLLSGDEVAFFPPVTGG